MKPRIQLINFNRSDYARLQIPPPPRAFPYHYIPVVGLALGLILSLR